MNLPQIFLKVATNENDGNIVRGNKSIAHRRSSSIMQKSLFQQPLGKVQHQEEESSDESGEIS